MKIILDGKNEAEEIAVFLEESEKVLGKSLVILQCDGHIDDSTYVRLKREMGERLGVLVSVLYAKNKGELLEMVKDANEDETVDGLIVQLPIIGATKEDTDQVLNSISPSKDVDGLNPKSRYFPAVIGAVERAMEIFNVNTVQSLAVVGAKGEIGKRLMERLKLLGFSPVGFDKNDDLMKLAEFDVIISVTGTEGAIKGEMVKEGYAGIDLGYPKGDFAAEAVAKAAMITPVPGGVGPLTIVSLYESLGEV